MKKLFALLLALTLVFAMAGCDNKELPAEPSAEPVETAEPAPTPTPEPTPEPEPETTGGIVRVLELRAVLTKLTAGDKFPVVGDVGDYYLVSTDKGFGYIEKRLVGTEKDPQYKKWIGYAKYNAVLYDNYMCEGEPAVKLGLNEEVKVVDALGDTLCVEYKGKTYYAAFDGISEYRYSYDYSANYSGGSSSANDGQDIYIGGLSFAAEVSGPVLLADGDELMIAPQEGKELFTGAAKVDGAPVYIAVLKRGEAVRVLEKGADKCVLYFDGITCEVDSKYILFDGDQPFTEKPMYAGLNCLLYHNPELLGEYVTLGVNQPVTVLEDFGGVVLAKCGETTGYVASENLNEKTIWLESWNSSGGGSSSGAEWTTPIM